MGLIEFVLLCVITLAIAGGGVWALRYFIPEHPAFIDKVIWGVAAGIILWNLLRATGVLNHDPQIPHV